jgi:hypothetical protein
MGSLNDKFRTFMTEVDKYSRICPPGFDTSTFESKNSRIKDAIEYVRLKVRILELIQQGDHKTLITMLDKVLMAVDRNANFLNAQVLLNVVDVLMEGNRGEALKFGRKILERTDLLNEESCQLIRSLLAPTIFDVEAANYVVIPKSNQSSPTRTVRAKDFGREDLIERPPAPTIQPNRRGAVAEDGKDAPVAEIFRVFKTVKAALTMIDLEM